MTEITMYDYILEEKDVLLNILQKRKTITRPFCTLLQEKNVDELVLCGSGTSYHAALAARRIMENLLQIRVRAELPSLFTTQQKIYSKNTLVLGISQGGNSYSTADALEKAKTHQCMTAGLSENSKSLIFRLSDVHLLMECGAELSIAKTKGYTATVLILWLLGIEGALCLKRISDSEAEELIQRLNTVITNYDAIIPAATRWVDAIQEELIEGRRILVLGYGNNYANVLEGSLKMLETLRFGIVGYDLEEFCHGIYNSIQNDTRLLYLASPDPYEKDRLIQIHSVIKETTNHQYIIGGKLPPSITTNKDCLLPMTDDPDFHVLEYILPLQIISSRIPYKLGINPFLAADPQFHKKAGSKLVTS